ncbi:hypothetical protein BDN72DRAFT_131344 [Pluteus cervinus]|uniref:Uncharacterized protein n=1 Tax=Pluteus cervinus TaxID=181527 RepID=A0ACD3AM16_9AGAR|nr:hypothetical protein BDN72DRAFT_131344 [Pluteus cervinus]
MRCPSILRNREYGKACLAAVFTTICPIDSSVILCVFRSSRTTGFRTPLLSRLSDLHGLKLSSSSPSTDHFLCFFLLRIRSIVLYGNLPLPSCLPLTRQRVVAIRLDINITGRHFDGLWGLSVELNLGALHPPSYPSKFEAFEARLQLHTLIPQFYKHPFHLHPYHLRSSSPGQALLQAEERCTASSMSMDERQQG